MTGFWFCLCHFFVIAYCLLLERPVGYEGVTLVLITSVLGHFLTFTDNKLQLLGRALTSFTSLMIQTSIIIYLLFVSIHCSHKFQCCNVGGKSGRLIFVQDFGSECLGS